MGLCLLGCARSEWDCPPERCSKGRLLSLINWLAFFCARASKAGILALFAQHIVAGCFGKIAPAATVATKYCLKYLAGASSKILIEICSLCCKMDPEEVHMRPKTAQNGVPQRSQNLHQDTSCPKRVSMARPESFRRPQETRKGPKIDFKRPNWTPNWSPWPFHGSQTTSKDPTWTSNCI